MERFRRNWRKPIAGVRAAVILASMNCGIRLVTGNLGSSRDVLSRTEVRIYRHSGYRKYWRVVEDKYNFKKF